MLNRLALGPSPIPRSARTAPASRSPANPGTAHLPAAGRPELLGKAASGGDVVRLS
jgi:hypothetical protein